MSPVRSLYAVLVNLHPRPFRERFSAELMSAFDEGAGSENLGFLFRDIVLSALRQWLKRPFRNSSIGEPVLATTSPLYCDLTDYRPGTSRLVCSFALLVGLGLLLHAARKSPRLFVLSRDSVLVTVRPVQSCLAGTRDCY